MLWAYRSRANPMLSSFCHWKLNKWCGEMHSASVAQKTSVTNAKWTNLFPFFTNSALKRGKVWGKSFPFSLSFFKQPFVNVNHCCCVPKTNPSRKYFNLTNHHFLLRFFIAEMSPTYKTFVPLPSLLSRFVDAHFTKGLFFLLLYQ